MRWFIVVVGVAATGVTPLRGDGAEDGLDRALSIDREVMAIARNIDLWPGFEPLAIPLAVFTGEATYLFRHPSPPEGFVFMPGIEPPVARHLGRHPAVTSNTNAELGGVMTAAVLAAGPRSEMTARELAAVALHESFHVFQRQRHPHWAGNEGDLVLYPFESGELLIGRRLETDALRRALEASTSSDATCWTRRALEARRGRFEHLEEPFRVYEQASEWNEGLAEYVQLRALGRRTIEIPKGGFAATDLRRRFYFVGPALAFLLDGARPDWREALEANDRLVLDELLGEAVAKKVDTACPALTPSHEATLRETARSDAAAVRGDRVARRTEVDRLPGPRVIVTAAPGAPFWPQGFDPLNLERVEGALVHSRFVRLGNESGELTAIDEDAADVTVLTIAAGEHPLFEGVRRVEILGLSALDPVVAGEAVSIEAAGLSLRLEPAVLEGTGDLLRVRVLESSGNRRP